MSAVRPDAGGNGSRQPFVDGLFARRDRMSAASLHRDRSPADQEHVEQDHNQPSERNDPAVHDLAAGSVPDGITKNESLIPFGSCGK